MVRCAPGKAVSSQWISDGPDRCNVAPVLKSMKSRPASGFRDKFPAEHIALITADGKACMGPFAMLFLPNVSLLSLTGAWCSLLYSQ